MRNRLRFVVALALGAAPVAAHPQSAQAQDIVKNVEYVGGKDGFADKKKGELALSSAGVRFTDKKGALIFAVPIAAIQAAAAQTDIRDASVGKKLLFGAFAGSRKQEFLTLTTETSETAEAIVFKLKQNTSAAAVAKINFYLKRAGRAPAAAAGPATSNHVPPS